MKFAEAILPFVPRGFHDSLAKTIAIVFYLIRARKRKIVMKNLKHIYFDRPVKKWMLKRMVWKTYCNFALSFLDTVKIPMFSGHELSGIFEDKASGNLKKALSLGRGVVLISLHLGNWDLGVVALGHLGLPVVAVTEKLEDRYFRFFKRRREKTGIEAVVTDEVLKMSRALKSNKAVVLVADRDITGSGQVVRFFDGQRKVPLGPIRFARRLNVPVVFGFLPFHYGDKRYLAHTEPYFFFGDKLEENLQMMVGFFEHAIRRYPDQWFVFEDEWIN